MALWFSEGRSDRTEGGAPRRGCVCAGREVELGLAGEAVQAAAGSAGKRKEAQKIPRGVSFSRRAAEKRESRGKTTVMPGAGRRGPQVCQHPLREELLSAAFLPRGWASCQFAGPRKKPRCSQRTRTSNLNPPPRFPSGLLGLQHFNGAGRGGVGVGGSPMANRTLRR